MRHLSVSPVPKSGKTVHLPQSNSTPPLALKKVAHLIQMILLFEQEEYVTMQAGIGGWSGVKFVLGQINSLEVL